MACAAVDPTLCGSSEPTLALLGHTDPTAAGPLAHAVHDVGLVSVLAFDTGQIRTYLAQRRSDVGVAVLDTRLAPGEVDVLVSGVRQRTDAAILTLLAGPTGNGSDDGADAHLPLDTPAGTIAAHARALAAAAHQRVRTPPLSWGRLHLDLETWEASVGGTILALTTAQFLALTLLIKEGGSVVSADRLAAEMFGMTQRHADTARVRAHIGRLRKRLRTGGGADLADLLVTVRGHGYRLLPPPIPMPARPGRARQVLASPCGRRVADG